LGTIYILLKLIRGYNVPIDLGIQTVAGSVDHAAVDLEISKVELRKYAYKEDW
jgi:hypothetical protein